jgi:hypothetical protein
MDVTEYRLSLSDRFMGETQNRGEIVSESQKTWVRSLLLALERCAGSRLSLSEKVATRVT